jgi:hypothetical protein
MLDKFKTAIEKDKLLRNKISIISTQKSDHEMPKRTGTILGVPIDSQIISALIQGGSAILAALIVSIISLIKRKKRNEQTKNLLILQRNIKIEIPLESKMEEIHEKILDNKINEKESVEIIIGSTEIAE